jgi:hypothetical protein
VLLLRAIAVAATILPLLPLLPLLAWLSLSRLTIGRVWLIGILRRALLLLAFAAAAGMLLVLLLMLIAVGRLRPLRRTTTAGPIGRHAALPATCGWILMWSLRLTRRAAGHIRSTLARTLLLIHPDREPAPLRRGIGIGRGSRLGGGWSRRGGRLILIRRVRLPTRMAHSWHAHTARARRFAIVVVVVLVVVVVEIGVIGSIH